MIYVHRYIIGRHWSAITYIQLYTIYVLKNDPLRNQKKGHSVALSWDLFTENVLF